jgi:hypothetical protein
MGHYGVDTLSHSATQARAQTADPRIAWHESANQRKSLLNARRGGVR